MESVDLTPTPPSRSAQNYIQLQILAQTILRSAQQWHFSEKLIGIKMSELQRCQYFFLLQVIVGRLPNFQMNNRINVV